MVSLDFNSFALSTVLRFIIDKHSGPWPSYPSYLVFILPSIGTCNITIYWLVIIQVAKQCSLLLKLLTNSLVEPLRTLKPSHYDKISLEGGIFFQNEFKNAASS